MIRQNQIKFTDLSSYFLNKSESSSETLYFKKIDVLYNVQCMFYLKNILRQKFLDLIYIISRFFV